MLISRKKMYYNILALLFTNPLKRNLHRLRYATVAPMMRSFQNHFVAWLVANSSISNTKCARDCQNHLYMFRSSPMFIPLYAIGAYIHISSELRTWKLREQIGQSQCHRGTIWMIWSAESSKSSPWSEAAETSHTELPPQAWCSYLL
jgi:hypothetical protein